MGRHAVTPSEVEEVLGGADTLAQTDDSHRPGRLLVWGRTIAGRYLLAVLDPPSPSGTAYVVTARPMDRQRTHQLPGGPVTQPDYDTTADAIDAAEHLPDSAHARRLNPAPTNEPKSALAVRLAGGDIDRLRAFAERTGEGPTQLARRFILEGLTRADSPDSTASPELVAAFARALERHSAELAALVVADINLAARTAS